MKVKIGEEEQPYFDRDFLVQRFLGLTPEQAEGNASYKELEAKSAKKESPSGEAESSEEPAEAEAEAPAEEASVTL